MSSQVAPRARTRRPVGDQIFAGAARSAGITIMLTLGAVFVFLLVEGLPGISTTSDNYAGKANFWAFVWPLLFGTVYYAFLALIIAVPFAIAIALFITFYAPKRLAGPVAYVIDLLAAIPSIVYGLWGGVTLAKALYPSYHWLTTHAGWIPIFKGKGPNGDGFVPSGQVGFTAVIVLAIMVLPIITAISREVFATTPHLQQEAAIGLGATRWEVIKLAVLPHARAGVIAGTMLGLGRALGETMAVFMIVGGPALLVSADMLGTANPQTIAAYIATNIGGDSTTAAGQSVLIAAGLGLFAVTFVVNFVARWVIARSEKAAR